MDQNHDFRMVYVIGSHPLTVNDRKTKPTFVCTERRSKLPSSLGNNRRFGIFILSVITDFTTLFAVWRIRKMENN